MTLRHPTSLLDLLVNARISAFSMALEIMLDRLESTKFDECRLDAWMCAEQAGYLNPEIRMPVMLEGVYELPDAWHWGQMRRQEELLLMKVESYSDDEILSEC